MSTDDKDGKETNLHPDCQDVNCRYPRCACVAPSAIGGTPRTDAEAFIIRSGEDRKQYQDGEYVRAAVARQLERELADLRHDLERGMANHNADLNAPPSASAPSGDERCDICLPDMPMDQIGVGWAWAAWNGKTFARSSAIRGTPRTDAVVGGIATYSSSEGQIRDLIEHACQLERELAEVKDRYERADERWMALGVEYERKLKALPSSIGAPEEITVPMIEAACASILEATGHDIGGDVMREALSAAVAKLAPSAREPLRSRWVLKDSDGDRLEWETSEGYTRDEITAEIKQRGWKVEVVRPIDSRSKA